MQVKINRAYQDAGRYDLDKISNEALGMLIRGLLDSVLAKDETYQKVDLEVIKEQEEDVHD